MPQDTYTDPMGQQVPAKYVKAYDKVRDRVAQTIAKEWTAERERLAKLKAKTLTAIDALQHLAAESVDVPDLGGKEGYIQFRSFDGRITVRVDNAKRTEFDERLQLAQRLIMEAIREMATDDTSADLLEIATRAFQPRKAGGLDMARIRDLKSYNVRHPKWKQAVDILNECERVVGYRRYVRVTVRAGSDTDPEPIILDIAAL